MSNRVNGDSEVCATHFLKDGQVSRHPKTVSGMVLGCLMYIPLQLLDQEEESYNCNFTHRDMHKILYEEDG